ncbi:MAG: hypothetical protein K6T99_03405 [Armatimonadetes bacterium]|nr:hypothetical protein [Armatimonadota bacterium]
MRVPVKLGFLLYLILILAFALPAVAQKTFDFEKLKKQVDITLVNGSMVDAMEALAKQADIEIAAPAFPEKGISTSLKGQPLKVVLDMLTKMTGLSWYIEGSIIVFRRPAEVATKDVPEKPLDKLTPEEYMTEVLKSLDGAQLFKLSRGFPLSYAELTPFQQEILRAMLASPTVGLTEAGQVVKSLPKPEETVLLFRIIPYLLIPRPDLKEDLALRMDSMPYIYLKKVMVP